MSQVFDPCSSETREETPLCIGDEPDPWPPTRHENPKTRARDCERFSKPKGAALGNSGPATIEIPPERPPGHEPRPSRRQAGEKTVGNSVRETV